LSRILYYKTQDGGKKYGFLKRWSNSSIIYV
jgi:hypothetical protein